MTDFASLLEGKVNDAEPPVPLPVGSYIVVVTRHDTGESSKKKTPYVRIYFKIEEAQPDVNVEELKKVKKLDKERYDDFYMTEDASFRLRELMEKNFKIRIANRSWKDALSEIPGKRSIVVMKQELTENQNKISKVDRWVPMPSK